MNRIYQGRVTGIEITTTSLDAAPSQTGAAASDEALWQHHTLFQDAVNYHLVALLALASPNNKALGQLRQRIAVPGDDFQIWTSFMRHGRKRPGLRDSIARYVTPGNEAPTLDEAFTAILAGNEADTETRDTAVTALLEACNGPGAIQQQGRAYLPKFCDPETHANFDGDPVMLRRELHRQLLPHVIHDPATRHDSPALDEFDTYSIATPDAKRPQISGTKARERLRQAVATWRERRPENEAEFSRLAETIERLPADLTLQGYVGSSAKGEVQLRLFALFLFKYLERSPFTLDLLRAAFPAPKGEPISRDVTSPAPAASADPIRLARGARGYVYRAFTSLPCWNPANTPRPQWKEFDIAAFKYALTALNQIEEKTKERQTEAEKLRARLAYMRGQTRKFTPTIEGEEPPPILAGDPRIERLRAVLASPELRTNNALTDGEASDYGLHPRTIRGFRELRKLWQRCAPAGTPYSEQKRGELREELRKFQTENSETIGSAALFEALLDKENWIVWQEPSPELASAWTAAGHATGSNDPLTALVEERELEERVERLGQPVKLTPADPMYSRRQYDFNAVSKFGTGTRAKCRHEPEACAFTTEIACQEQGIWRPTRVRIRYSAPRLLRDGLREHDGSTDLATARWLQPMMEALAPAPSLPQDLTDCPVCLMPDVSRSGDRRILLNFPVTLDPTALVAQLGRTQKWEGQFCGPKDAPFALRWPADGWDKSKEPAAWYHRRERFSVLGVDLGTRDAGALAHITVTPESPIKPVHRTLGEAGGCAWFAQLTGTELIRLPGEDAKVFINGERVTELYGERGRGASDLETSEAVTLCQALGESPDLLGSESERRSFPKQNDRLLIALRRAQARLARLQSWSWRLRDERESAKAIEEIASARNDLTALPLADLQARIDADLLAQRELVSRSLVTLANRILPLRGRRWIWVLRDDGSRCHVLLQTDPGTDPSSRKIAGQRGLSHERMEQLEELRRRCQSLNRALRHAPGEKVVIGRRTKGDELPDPCPELLAKIEHLRDQRVDQTAHAILAAALGVRLRAPVKARDERRTRDIHGEYERFREPVDFIVIEDLSRYLSSQDRARRENTRLMQWCHRQIVAKLRQLCETYGIPVLATPAAYSSRFCSRTGVAGFRAIELTPAARDQAPWRWQLQRLADDEAGVKRIEADARAEAERVRTLFDRLDRLNAGRAAAKKPLRTLLAPLPGGPIFVPIVDGPTMQADLNAATNIALRAVAAPTQHDIHQRVRTERSGKTLRVRTTSKREKARWSEGAPELDMPDSATTADRTPNLFADIAQAAEFDRVTLPGVPCGFATGRGLWTSVKRRAWNRVEELNRARIAKWEMATDDDILA